MGWFRHVMNKMTDRFGLVMAAKCVPRGRHGVGLTIIRHL